MTTRGKSLADAKQAGRKADAQLIAKEIEAEKDAEAVRWWAERTAERLTVPPISSERSANGSDVAMVTGEQFAMRFAQLSGSINGGWGDCLIGQLGNVTSTNQDVASFAKSLVAGLGFLATQEPQNEIEAAILGQMFGVHCATMDMVTRYMKADTAERRAVYGNLLNKSARTFAVLAETFAKLRGKGKQEVTVIHEHRHTYVAPGGQAITGDVFQGGRGGVAENAGQPHAPARACAETGSICAPMLSEEPRGPAVPSSLAAREKALSPPRRAQPRRAKG